MPELKPKETIHQQNPSVPPAKPVPATPAPAKAAEPVKAAVKPVVKPADVPALKIALYRGQPVDIKKLAPNDKAALLEALAADSRAESVQKHPDREKLRENARKLLK